MTSVFKVLLAVSVTTSAASLFSLFFVDGATAASHSKTKIGSPATRSADEESVDPCLDLERAAPPPPPRHHASASTPTTARNGEQLAPMLNIALLSASVGKYFLNRKMNVSAECHETAMATVELWQRLSIVQRVDALIRGAYEDIVADADTLRAALRNPVAAVCAKIEKRFAQDAALLPEFARLKEWMRRRGVRKGYTNVTDAPKTLHEAERLIADEFEDPFIGRLLAHVVFVDQLKPRHAAPCPQYRTWAAAILQLARDEKLGQAAQILYDKTRSEISNSLLSPPPPPPPPSSFSSPPSSEKHSPADLLMPLFAAKTMKNLKRNFESDVALAAHFLRASNDLQQRGTL